MVPPPAVVSEIESVSIVSARSWAPPKRMMLKVSVAFKLGVFTYVGPFIRDFHFGLPISRSIRQSPRLRPSFGGASRRIVLAGPYPRARHVIDDSRFPLRSTDAIPASTNRRTPGRHTLPFTVPIVSLNFWVVGYFGRPARSLRAVLERAA
jgi:hypothetical protein